MPVATRSEFYINPYKVSVSDWFYVEPVDVIIEELIINRKITTYINSTNKKIIKNLSFFKDLGSKFE